MKFSPALSFIVRACKEDVAKINRVFYELGLSTLGNIKPDTAETKAKI